MTTPEQQPQYQSQPQYQAQPQGQPQAQQNYAAYQQPTGGQAYAPYAPPRQPGSSSIAGGVWGIILLAVGGLLTLVGLIALLVVMISEYPSESLVLEDAFLSPGLILLGIFLGLQTLSVVLNAQNSK